LYYTASDSVTPAGGRPVHRLIVKTEIVQFVVQICIATDICWSGWTLLVITLVAVHALYWWQNFVDLT